MLLSIENKTMRIVCNVCGTITDHDLTGVKSVFLEEFQEYDNLSFSCPGCLSSEVFNVNIPVDDIMEPFESGDLPPEEEIQRFYVRLLIRMTRDDFNS